MGGGFFGDNVIRKKGEFQENNFFLVCKYRNKGMLFTIYTTKMLVKTFSLVTVVTGLVRTFNRDGKVVRLDGGQFTQLNTQLVQMSTGNFFVKLLGQDVDTKGPFTRLSPQGNLSQDLVGERVGHDEGRMASSTTQVDKTTFSEQDNVVTALHGETIDLGLDVDTFNSVSLDIGDIDFDIEMANVTDNSIILHAFKVSTGDDITTTSGGDVDVGFLDSFFHSGDFITFHGSLESVDGIDFGNQDTGTESTEGSSTTLTDITVTSDNGNLTGDHDISGTLDTINKGFTATVQVVELGLGDGVVDVDGRQLQSTVLQHLVQVVDTSGGFFGKTLDTRKQLRVLFVDNVGQITTIIKNHVQGLTIREVEGLFNTPDEFFISFTLPGIDWDTSGSNGSSGVVLGGETIL